MSKITELHQAKKKEKECNESTKDNKGVNVRKAPENSNRSTWIDKENESVASWQIFRKEKECNESSKDNKGQAKM